MAALKTTAVPARKTAKDESASLRDRVLDDAKTLKLPLSSETLDSALAQAEQQGLSHLNFLELIFGEPAARSRQRAIERRIREARFREDKRLSDFDWKFNASAIDRAQIEQLATGEFLRSHDNLVMVGQSGVGNPLDLWTAVCELPLYQAAIHLSHVTGIALPRLSSMRRCPKRHSSSDVASPDPLRNR